jgi:ribose 5-phosphate isomerase
MKIGTGSLKDGTIDAYLLQAEDELDITVDGADRTSRNCFACRQCINAHLSPKRRVINSDNTVLHLQVQ